jgi:hypothetical protein
MSIDLLPWTWQPVNRPITHEEQRFHLDPKQRTKSEPICQLGTIRINSTFLEQVDVFHEMRGVATAVSIALLSILLWLVILGLIYLANAKSSQLYIQDSIKQGLIGFSCLFILFILPALAILFFDCFRLTHYPILLNRKTRMVHAFRRKGTILSIPWDDLYLTLKYNKKTYLKDWSLLGHVMDPDGFTVRETILFPTRENEEAAIRLWEYTRRFMEEGPQDLYAISDLCLPIWDRKEPFNVGLARLMGLMGFLQIPLFPVLFVFAIGRYIAGLTNKIPVWPKEILETCQIDANDPCARDWRSNISWWKFRQRPAVKAAKPQTYGEP